MPSDERVHTNGCKKCAVYQQKNWQNSNLIGYVNLSMYPAPCNAKCIYCNAHKSDYSEYFVKDTVKNAYESMFDAIDYMVDNDMVRPEALWQISSGEIAIHPYKDRILSVCRGKRCMFLTNCFIYDEQIGNNLSLNPKSSVNLSIDAGTSETWHQIKGVDNFYGVVENLHKYHKQCLEDRQITLKYIILPGINDNNRDYMGVIDIMKSMGIKNLTIGRDSRTKYKITQDERKELIASAATLCMRLQENDIAFEINAYTADEQKQMNIYK